MPHTPSNTEKRVRKKTPHLHFLLFYSIFHGVSNMKKYWLRGICAVRSSPKKKSNGKDEVAWWKKCVATPHTSVYSYSLFYIFIKKIVSSAWCRLITATAHFIFYLCSAPARKNLWSGGTHVSYLSFLFQHIGTIWSVVRGCLFFCLGKGKDYIIIFSSGSVYRFIRGEINLLGILVSCCCVQVGDKFQVSSECISFVNSLRRQIIESCSFFPSPQAIPLFKKSFLWRIKFILDKLVLDINSNRRIIWSINLCRRDAFLLLILLHQDGNNSQMIWYAVVYDFFFCPSWKLCWFSDNHEPYVQYRMYSL